MEAIVEMNCVFHPTNSASARCGACERPLCPACDHRIKGIPCCQDCIVTGIETLRRNNSAGHRIVHRIVNQEEKSPLIALLLGLVPGVGAAYNGQNIKALTHFLAVVGLWVLADIFGKPLEIAFGFGSVAFYFYSLYDAFQSAQRLRRGEDLSIEDGRLKLFLQERMNLFGFLLIGVGAFAMLDFIFPQQLRKLWPFVLIIAGAYLVWSYYRNIGAPQVKLVYRTPPPSAITSSLDPGASEFARAENRLDT
jgi:TM2 domain-containing membrane protein YozV